MSKHKCCYFLGLLALTLSACNKTPDTGYQGYAEGDYQYLSAPYAGFLQTLVAERGTRADAGARLFMLSAEPERFAVDGAEAIAASGREKILNLRQPRRRAEIDAKRAELKQAQADLAYTESQLQRFKALQEKGFVAKDELDDARAARDRNAARVEAAREQLASFRLALGRDAEILGAEAELKAAEAQSAQHRWQLASKTVEAPSAGEVTEVYYRPGEWVPAGKPVLSFLPDSRRLIRFFVPETELAGIALGQTVSAACDGCTVPVEARVTFIGAEAEYTPPVIYSKEERAKLVFRVEAEPNGADALKLHPGLPMRVRVFENKP
ncbi:MAG: HlyD family secretion protein [Gammaproteobacteria bacterium]